ncbi:hypothetical protein GOP47_0017397 [Adiantum capillus-veneris]|uniref:Uncharacterized protein n=1 Tax=Adiantum capillus-veneris TaxID=13818 RepID=A0A9D4UGB6_ADICA|nr:hypothetical protein GOP47_0017397 [Adiantum capillus-veneris]
MLRLWLPQRHLLFHRQPSSSWRSPVATPSIFLHQLYTCSFCLDRCSRITASSSESSISTLQKKSKGQKKREALRSVDWAVEFANFSDSQLRRAIRWGNLQGEVYDAVRIVKKIGRYGKNARSRQLKLIGGMLREVDPELMEAIIKAIKDGDVEGVFNKPGALKDEDEREKTEDNSDDYDNDSDNDDYEDDLDEEEDEDDESESSLSEGELDQMEHDKDIVDRWLQGLLSGDPDVIAEVYSIRSASFNRQELRRLVRDILKSENRTYKGSAEDDVLQRPASATEVLDPRAKLRAYLKILVVKKSR